MVNLEWYRTFKYVHDYGSFTMAAEKLYMSQPGVGKQITALEAQVGKQLFERSGRRLLPTEYGKFLYSQVVGYLEGLEKAEQKFKRGSNKNCPSLVIGCPHDFFSYFIRDKIADINMYLTFKFGEGEELKDFLEKDKIHLMVSDSEHTNLNHQFSEISKGNLKLYASYDLYREVPFERITKDNSKDVQHWLSKQVWYAYDNELSYILDFWKMYFNSRPQIMAKYVFPSFMDIAVALEIGKGLTVLPDYIGELFVEQGKLAPIFENGPEHTLFWVNKKNTDYHYEINLLKEALNL